MGVQKVFDSVGIHTPPAVHFFPGQTENIAGQLAPIGDKFVVKPCRQGSSVGVTMTNGLDQTIRVAQTTFETFGDCIIEKFIKGREITAAILCDNVLPLLEIRSNRNFFDYKAKYEDDATEFLFDTIETKILSKKYNK